MTTKFTTPEKKYATETASRVHGATAPAIESASAVIRHHVDAQDEADARGIAVDRVRRAVE